jgi:hypothetical protein
VEARQTRICRASGFCAHYDELRFRLSPCRG